jgi:dipeptidyl aminopeptidase/acylaminoacyl peptidase
MWLQAISLAATVTLGATAPSFAQTPEIVKPALASVETYVKNADFLGFKLSPNGRLLASSIPIRGRQNLVIIDLEKRAINAITGEKQFDVVGFNWVSDSRLVYSLGNLGEPNSGDFQKGGGLFAVDKDGKNGRVLSDTVDNQIRAGVYVYRGLGFVSRAPREDNPNEDSDTDIIATSRERSARSVDLVRVNTMTGRKQLITTSSPGNVEDWITDNNGVPRVAISTPSGTETVVYYRSTATSPWKELRRVAIDGPKFAPLDFDFDNKTLYVATNEGGRDKTAIFKYDPETNTLGALIAEHPVVDVGLDEGGGGDSGALRGDRDKKTLVAVGINGVKPERIWFDPEYEKMQKSIDAALPGTYNSFSRTRISGARKTLVRARSDRQPLKYYLLDEEKHTLEELISTRKDLGPDQLVEERPVVIPTRDGKKLQGYLFLPKGAKVGDKLPMVLNVHGGPQVRADSWADDGWGYREGQLFASRGYAVLLPNFRMTPGFGAEIFFGGRKQMGQVMQEDKEDAVAWAVAQGIANPSKVCIYGASYGGYAALQGIVKTPDLYACSVALLGPSDIRRQITSPLADFSQSENAIQFLSWLWGDPDKDRAMLEAISPAFHADRIKTPLLMIYGQDDHRVPLEQGEKMKSALDKAGKKYEWMVVPEEGHGFGKIENRVAVYDKILNFLDRNIGPGH